MYGRLSINFPSPSICTYMYVYVCMYTLAPTYKAYAGQIYASISEAQLSSETRITINLQDLYVSKRTTTSWESVQISPKARTTKIQYSTRTYTRVVYCVRMYSTMIAAYIAIYAHI